GGVGSTRIVSARITSGVARTRPAGTEPAYRAGHLGDGAERICRRRSTRYLPARDRYRWARGQFPRGVHGPLAARAVPLLPSRDATIARDRGAARRPRATAWQSTPRERSDMRARGHARGHGRVQRRARLPRNRTVALRRTARSRSERVRRTGPRSHERVLRG